MADYSVARTRMSRLKEFVRKVQRYADQDVSLFPEEHPDVVITKAMMEAGLEAGKGMGGEDYYDLRAGDIEAIFVAMFRAYSEPRT